MRLLTPVQKNKNECVIADDCSYESSYCSKIGKCHLFNKFNFKVGLIVYVKSYTNFFCN